MRARILTLTSAVVLAAGTVASLHVLQRRPDEPHRYVENIRRLDYAPPPIPRPNATTEGDGAAINRLEGFIAEPDLPLGGPVVWLGVGDSTTLFIQDMHCVVDACKVRQSNAVPTWSIDDSSVAILGALYGRRPSTRLPGSRIAVVVGRRVGRTAVRAFLPLSAADTLPGRTPPSSALRRTVNVTLPVQRVKLELIKPDTLRAEKSALFRAYAFDKSGRRIAGAPVQVNVAPEGLPQVPDKHGLALLALEQVGRQTIVASLRGRSDTMVMQVLPPTR